MREIAPTRFRMDASVKQMGADDSKPWQRGGPSPNPKGRLPVGLTLAAAIRQRFPVEDLLDVAADLLACEDAKVRLQTLQLLIDRAHGKVMSTVEITDRQPDAMIDWSAVSIERRRTLMLALSEVEAITETANADESVEH